MHSIDYHSSASIDASIASLACHSNRNIWWNVVSASVSSWPVELLKYKLITKYHHVIICILMLFLCLLSGPVSNRHLEPIEWHRLTQDTDREGFARKIRSLNKSEFLSRSKFGSDSFHLSHLRKQLDLDMMKTLTTHDKPIEHQVFYLYKVLPQIELHYDTLHHQLSLLQVRVLHKLGWQRIW